MQDKVQALLSNLLSDEDGKEMVKGLVSTLTVSSENDQTLNSPKQLQIKKNIDLISSLLPIVPQKNVKKAHLIIKILETAMLLDEIKQESDN